MDENRVPEAEIVDDQACRLTDAVDSVVNETAKLFDALGRALVITAQDVSNLMVIKVDRDMREHLDLMVDAGVAKNRHDAVTSLIHEGIRAKSVTFERIRRTKRQIAELRQQMRSLVETRP
ncbi:MAG: hypothetical protein ACP5HG_01340 [Anaerolineae bacterium]